jgi:hypothetical protein
MVLKKASILKKILKRFNFSVRFGSYQSKGMRPLGKQFAQQLKQTDPEVRFQKYLRAKLDNQQTALDLSHQLVLKYQSKAQIGEDLSKDPNFQLDTLRHHRVVQRLHRDLVHRFPDEVLRDSEDTLISAPAEAKGDTYLRDSESSLPKVNYSLQITTSAEKILGGGSALPKVPAVSGDDSESISDL